MKKNFCQDQKHSLNNRWIACNNSKVQIVSRPSSRRPSWCFASSPARATSTLHIYVVKPWILRVARGRPFVWQQDSAPCHTSRRSQMWLSNKIFDYTSPNIWPSNSPGCNLCDYYLWGAVERQTNRTSCNGKDELIARIKAVFSHLPRGQVLTACSRFRGRLERVLKADGGFFE